MGTQPSTDGKRRLLGRAGARDGPSPVFKILVVLGVLGILGLLLAVTDPEASLRHLKVGFLSGAVSGNYHAVVARVAAAAAARKGRVTNLASAGSVENVARLIAARRGCSAHFALVQEGIDLPEGSRLELIGRLSRPESLIILGRNADHVTSPDELRGARVGIGPVGSGTEFVMRRLLAPFGALQLRLSTHPIDEQIQQLERGELDFSAMVIDDDAAQLKAALRDRRLQILSLPRAEALASGLPFLRKARIEAGHYDPVRALPPTDKTVLQVDTLILGNGCASRSATQSLIGVFSDLDPLFLKDNRETPNLSGLPYASVAHTYYETGGPDLVGVYAPWVVDIMPTASWVQLALAVSILFNAIGALNRYRLYRLDAARVRIERELPEIFRPGITVGEIPRAQPDPTLDPREVRARVESIIEQLEELAGRCRKQSLSVVVPMGGEMAYRYQEQLVTELLHALRTFEGEEQTAQQTA